MQSFFLLLELWEKTQPMKKGKRMRLKLTKPSPPGKVARPKAVTKEGQYKF